MYAQEANKTSVYAHDAIKASVGSGGLANVDVGERQTEANHSVLEKNLHPGPEKLARSPGRRDGSRDVSRRPNIELGDIKSGKVSCLSKPQ